jgi:hypothetical protein
MGMFDTVRFPYRMPDGHQSVSTYQTKDLDCIGDSYCITADGRLVREGPGEAPELEGMLNIYDLDLQGHRHEYDLAFLNGLLVLIHCRQTDSKLLFDPKMLSNIGGPAEMTSSELFNLMIGGGVAGSAESKKLAASAGKTGYILQMAQTAIGVERLTKALVLLGYSEQAPPHHRTNLLHAIESFAVLNGDHTLEAECEAMIAEISRSNRAALGEGE